MPRPSDNPDHPDTLPPPELNPLLNPLLGQNMGRWAEVYFTSPPEKREEAVMELLSELETESRDQQKSPGETRGQPLTAAPSLAERLTPRDLFPAEPAPEPNSEIENCRACGFENPPDKRFCGMCGARMREELIAEHARAEESGFAEHSSARIPQAESFSRQSIPQETAADEFPWREKFSLFRADEELRAHNNRVNRLYGSDSSPYRRFIGAGLAVVILAIGYVAWHGTQHTSQDSQTALPPAAPVAADQQTPAEQQTPPPAATPAKTDAPEATIPAEAQKVVASATALKSDENGARTERREEERRAIESHRVVHTVRSSAASAPAITPPAATGSGADEFATATGYLNGTNGYRRNSAEAAGWLWKAVAKHNRDATLLLSDLYLRGEGVSKNCDQARVLLDAAARQGMKDAADRLRNLQAFGCQ